VVPTPADHLDRRVIPVEERHSTPLLFNSIGGCQLSNLLQCWVKFLANLSAAQKWPAKLQECVHEIP
jgi:hypothetical protein